MIIIIIAYIPNVFWAGVFLLIAGVTALTESQMEGREAFEQAVLSDVGIDILDVL